MKSWDIRQASERKEENRRWWEGEEACRASFYVVCGAGG